MTIYLLPNKKRIWFKHSYFTLGWYIKITAVFGKLTYYPIKSTYCVWMMANSVLKIISLKSWHPTVNDLCNIHPLHDNFKFHNIMPHERRIYVTFTRLHFRFCDHVLSHNPSSTFYCLSSTVYHLSVVYCIPLNICVLVHANCQCFYSYLTRGFWWCHSSYMYCCYISDIAHCKR